MSSSLSGAPNLSSFKQTCQFFEGRSMTRIAGGDSSRFYSQSKLFLRVDLYTIHSARAKIAPAARK